MGLPNCCICGRVKCLLIVHELFNSLFFSAYRTQSLLHIVMEKVSVCLIESMGAIFAGLEWIMPVIFNGNVKID